jgi:toxin HigB-1
MYGYAVHYPMLIVRFLHKGLKRLYEDDDPSGLPQHSIRKIKAILAALEFADELSEVATLPGWKLHALKGSRKGEYSITITRNWRITFRIQGTALTDLNFEDYH